MSKFVFTYRAPTKYAPTEDPTAAWNAWFGSMGDNVADFGDQVYLRSTIGNSGPDTCLGRPAAHAASEW